MGDRGAQTVDLFDLGDVVTSDVDGIDREQRE